MSTDAPPPPYPGAPDPAYPPKDGTGPPGPANYAAAHGQPGGYPPTGQPSYAPGQPGYPPPGYPGGPPPQPGQTGYPQPGYPQPGYPQAQGGTVVVNQPTTVVSTTVIQQFRESPVQTICPSCQAQVVTATNYETGTFTWVICVILCLVGCDLGCCFIPFCVDGCKDVIHTCPNCHHTISRWSRM